MTKKSTIQLAKNLLLPNRAITESIAIMGRKGSGKTYTGGLLFEQMYAAGAQCVALDPVGNWWGLRLSKTGKGRGLDIPVFGGDHGDIQITPESGKMLAELIVERRLSCVIDLMNFRKAERKRFVTAFAVELLELKKRQRSPLHLFLEEARKFIPQRVTGEDAPMVGAFEDIVRLGRNYGLGVSLIDQRPQSVNKEVLSQSEILIIHQLTGSHERKAIEDWVKDKASDSASALTKLSELQPGEAFFWSPGLMQKFARLKIGRKSTYDASSTPELGDAGSDVEPRPLSAGDLEQLLKDMSSVVEAAEKDDPKKLRAKLASERASTTKHINKLERHIDKLDGHIDKLEAELSQLDEETTHLAAELATVEEAPVASESIEKLEQLYSNLATLGSTVGDAVESALCELNAVIVRPSRQKPGSKASGERRRKRTNGVPQKAAKPAKTRQNAAKLVAAAGTRRELEKLVIEDARAERAELTGPEQRILDAIAWLEAVGVEKPQLVAVAFLAGYRAGGGAFNNPRGKLRAAGLVEYASGKRIFLTNAGMALAEHPLGIDLTVEGLQNAVLTRLGGPEKRILTPLLEAYPESLSNAELAKAAGYAIGGAFNNPRGRLRSLGLIDYPESGRAVACGLLFLED